MNGYKVGPRNQPLSTLPVVLALHPVYISNPRRSPVGKPGTLAPTRRATSLGEAACSKQSGLAAKRQVLTQFGICDRLASAGLPYGYQRMLMRQRESMTNNENPYLKRRAFLRLAGGMAPVAFLRPGSGFAQGGRKPNIIVIVADDLGYADVGFQGLRAFETPNLARLAAAGVRVAANSRNSGRKSGNSFVVGTNPPSS